MRILRKSLLLALAYCMLVTQAFAVGYDYVETKDFEFEDRADKSELIKNAFDTYRYRMTVEWDQDDSTFKEYAKSELEKDILELQSQGISITEIQKYVTSTMLDVQTKNDYEALVGTLKKQGKSEEEISNITTKFMEKNHQVGASYSGGMSSGSGCAIAAVLITLIIIAVVTVIVVKKSDDDNNNHDEDPNGCYGYWCKA